MDGVEGNKSDTIYSVRSEPAPSPSQLLPRVWGKNIHFRAFFQTSPQISKCSEEQIIKPKSDKLETLKTSKGAM